jgi:formate hydrogenlyase subunit 3/multisubunit Na+/H+ antiporter MnhD subunit
MEAVMTGLNLFIVGAIITLLFICGIWLTFSEFKNIEDGRTNRRKRIDEDVKRSD